MTDDAIREDKLYLQEDGAVIAINYRYNEWRTFNLENFPGNSEFKELYTQLEDERNEVELAPPGLDKGIEIEPHELYNHNESAYDELLKETEATFALLEEF